MTKKELPLKCQDCWTTNDLAQCPECHLWFCRIHEMHECFPKRDDQFRKQIKQARNRRSIGSAITYIGAISVVPTCLVLLILALGGIAIKELSSGLAENSIAYASFLIGGAALAILGVVIHRHYDNRLGQLGARVHKERNIRPENVQEIEQLCEDLKRIGLKATMESTQRIRLGGVPGIGGSWIIGSVRVANRNIDLVELNYSVSRTVGVGDYPGGDPLPNEYWCTFVVQGKVNGLEEKLKAKGKPVRKSFFSRQVVDFRWKGKELAQILNSDAKLKGYLLSQHRPSNVEIEPFREEQCVRIVGKHITPPAVETFEAFDRIAQHIRDIANVHP